MDNTNRYFKGQQRDEQLVYYTRKHWITLMPIMIESVAFLGIFAGLVAMFLLAKKDSMAILTMAVIIVTAMTFWIHRIFMKALNYFLEIVLVTNFRVIRLQKTLYLRDDKNVVDLHEIQDIKKIQQGLIANILNYGKLVVVVPTMIEPMILESIPDPDRFFRKVNNAKRDYIYDRQQQRLGIMSNTKQAQYAFSGAT